MVPHFFLQLQEYQIMGLGETVFATGLIGLLRQAYPVLNDR